MRKKNGARMLGARRAGVVAIIAFWYGLATPLSAVAAGPPEQFPLSFPSRLGNLSLSFTEFDWNQKTGDFIIPGEIKGKTAKSDFRADRANGNDKVGYITLIGHVVVHSQGGGQGARAGQPVSVTSDQLRYDYRAGIYTATGNVHASQGDATLAAAAMRLDDTGRVADLSGGVHYQEAGGRSLSTQALTYHTDNGDYLVPGQLSGNAPDGSFSADSASGNGPHNDVTLVGDVVVHKLGGFRKVGDSNQPITLECTTLQVQSSQKLYTASGHVKVIQGARVMTAPLMRLDDNTHVLKMTGGVHAIEPPSSTFDAPEVIYNTETQDFRALGGVHATVPVNALSRKASPKPKSTPESTKPPAH